MAASFLYFSTSELKSGNSASTASASLPAARRPGVPFAVMIGMRAKIDSKGVKEAGSVEGGSISGRKPRWVDTVKGGVQESIGVSELKTGKGNFEGTGDV